MQTQDDHVRSTKTYQIIADRLVREIVSSDLAVGEVVPTERELSERYGVGRSSVREGLRLLEAHGVIISGKGGTYRVGLRNAVMVASLEMLLALGEANLHDIHDVRTMLEVQAAGLAARHRTTEDLEMIRNALRQMIEARGNTVKALRADLDFHVALARASRNGALTAMILGLREVLSQNLENRLVDIDEAITQHQLIVEAVVVYDEYAARIAAAKHMEWIAAT